MRFLLHCCVALLFQLGMLFVAFAQVGQGLTWRTFVIPEYGTRIEYPAAIFAAVGATEKGLGKRLRPAMVGPFSPSTPGRTSPATRR